MMRWTRIALAGAALVCTSATALADQYEEARGWIERMSRALQETDYQGTFVYMRGQQVETLRITHLRQGDNSLERMVTLSGPHREIIRDSEGVLYLQGDDQPVATQSPLTQSMFPEVPVEALEEAREGYKFIVGKKARIAGHKGKRITILPRDQYRYGYDLWLEEETGLLLRWVIYDSSRRPLAKLMFTDLRLGGKVDSAELQSETPMDAFVRMPSSEVSAPAQASLDSRWQPQAMPPGFRLAGRNLGAGDNDESFEHLVYSDGLASVSVYIELKDAVAAVNEGLSRMGTTNAYSRDAGARQVTAIGQVPAVTVQAIGNAFATPVASSD